MQSILLAYALGLSLLALPFALPVLSWPVAGLLGLICSATLLTARLAEYRLAVRYALLSAILIAGYVQGAWVMQQALANRVPQCADEQLREFEVRIRSKPDLIGDLQGPRWQQGARFRADVRLEPALGCFERASHTVRLTWYDPPVLSEGDVWQVEGKLRPPWGYQNPGGFDYERWLLGEGLQGTGYIRSGKLLSKAHSSDWSSELSTALARTHADIRRWWSEHDARHGPVLHALLTGDDSAITSQQWGALRASGTIHLVVVSGLHVGIVAGFAFFIGQFAARLCPWLLLVAGARRAGIVFALLTSGAYVAFTGAGVPALRAWLMSLLILTGSAFGVRTSVLGLLLVVFAVVLAGNPLVVHQAGFWLSFGAVAALLLSFASQAMNPRRLFQLGQTQIVLFVALSPLIALLQGGWSLSGPVVNLLVVPFVTFVVLPLVLLIGATLNWFPQLALAALWAADLVLDLVMKIISIGSVVPLVQGSGIGLLRSTVLLAIIVALLSAPQKRWWWVLALGWLSWILPTYRLPSHGSFQVVALDVGQGSAILVNTRTHRLIYDTGPGFASGFNLGEAAVVPSFLATGPPQLDALVLSHDDIDHTGGARFVSSNLSPQRIWTSFSTIDSEVSGNARVARCLKGNAWHWDGVHFSFVNPEPVTALDDNDRSCVLLIEASHRTALLSGDISQSIERMLVREGLPSIDLLFAPHHGSNNSSSAQWIGLASQQTAMVSAPRRSRYGHPHAAVVERFRRAGVELHVTGAQGALLWSSDNPEHPGSWRRDHAAYWN